MPRPLPLAVLACLPLLGACEGRLRVDLAAAPADGAARIELAVSSIELLGSDGGTTRIDPDTGDSVNLLDYADGDTLRLLDADGDVSGSYIGLRLRLDDSNAYVRTSGGATVPLEVLSAGEYAKLNLDLDESSSVALIAEIDLRFSLIDRVADLGVYQLLPAMRVVDADTWGSIEGTIDATAINDSDCRNGRSAGTGVAVYAYSGFDIAPTDYYDSGSIVNLDQPLASAAVAQGDDGLWRYTIRHLTPGDYSVAWTCEGDAERPREDDGLRFRASTNVSVGEMDAVSVDF